MPRWEHCKLEDYFAQLIGRSTTSHVVTMTIYKANEEVQVIEKDVPTEDLDDYWNKTIARLGARGWELVTVRTEEKEDESIGGYAILIQYFFKRPAPPAASQ
jgi:hypothetical protein